MLSVSLGAALLALFATPALGQVTSDCNPMERDGCPANPAFGTAHAFDLAQEPSEALWEQTVRGVEFDSEHGALFTISNEGESPTLRTMFYFFYGRTEIHMKCAQGTGIISSTMWLSDVLDEVDFEMFGTKGTLSASNYFGKGVQKFTNGGEHTVSGDIRDAYHNYTTVWTAEKLEWWIDGAKVRTLVPDDAKNSTTNESYYPQTPMRLSIGIWAGGDPDLPEGTRQWAGGDTDYTKSPFTMYVKNVTVEDYTTGAKEYTYSDRTGSADSIKSTGGTSEALSAIKDGRLTSSDDNIQQDTGGTIGKSASNSWTKLPSTTKIAIIASICGVVGLAAIVGAFYCWRQRRTGRAQAALAERQWNDEREAEHRMRKAGAIGEQSTEYDPRSMSSEKAVGVTTTMLSGAAVAEAHDRNNSLRRGNSWELQPQQAWDPTSGAAGPQSADGSHEPPRSPPRSATTPAPNGSPDSGGYDYETREPVPVPRSYTSPRQQYDNYSYGRL